MDYVLHLAIISTLYISLAVSLNLLVGYTGVLSICQAAFYGVGAYGTAILMKSHGFGFLEAAGVAMLITLLVALFIGFILSRVEGDYYALGSFGFAIIVYSLFLNLNSVTGGSLGIFGIPRPTVGSVVLTENSHFLIFSLLISIVIVGISFLITRSHFGRVLRAIRDDEAALAPFSYKTYRYKLIIFAISAVFASVVGSLYATYISFIDPSSFSLNESIYILTIVILGGLASLRGSIAGAIILTLLPEILRFVGLSSDVAAQVRVILYGAALMYLMYKRPSGLFGKYSP
jgi:branched-chain amino acid transport system permease protein